MTEISLDKNNIDHIRAARAAGRRVTAIGGGTGLSTLLLGLKEYTDNITAVVTVTDDGGGSGIIRQDYGMLPPGDIRNCILALANTSSTMSDLINYRFKEGYLKGQSFGNLLLLALNGISGSFDEAVAKMNQFLAVTGTVLPVTNSNIVLQATFEDGSVVCGETSITAAKKLNGLAIKKVEIVPQAKALPQVTEAIEHSDVIVLGPGSLYTSVIPNLLVDGVAQAIIASKALKIYVLNIMTQEGETENYSASRHVQELNRHAGANIIDVCIFNTEEIHEKLTMRYAGENSVQLFPDRDAFFKMGIKLSGAGMLSKDRQLVRHDPLRLAHHVMLSSDALRPREGLLRQYDQFLLRRE